MSANMQVLTDLADDLDITIDAQGVTGATATSTTPQQLKNKIQQLIDQHGKGHVKVKVTIETT